MKQVAVQEDATIAITEVDRPEPGPGEVLVRSRAVGICGSDTHAIAGHHPFLYPPYIPGHEAMGVVEALGAGVAAPAPGTRVMLQPNLSCGECGNCAAGRTNACQNLRWIGCDSSGQLAGAAGEFFVAPATNLFPVSDAVDNETAVLVECLATPVHAVAKAGDLSDARVVIIGAGSIGLLTLVAATHAGARTIAVLDMEQGKLDRALGQGATAAFLNSDPNVAHKVVDALGGHADVVFDCVAHETTVEQAFSFFRRAGSIMIVGVPPRPFSLNMPLIQDWEVRLQGCAAYTAADIRRALEIAESGGIPTDVIVTGRYGIDDAVVAFAAAAANSSGKVMIHL